MTKQEMIFWLEEIEKEIFVCSLESKLTDDLKSCALHGAIDLLKQDIISRADAIKAMDDLEMEDIKAYGCKIPEGFDGERARMALLQIQPLKIN